MRKLSALGADVRVGRLETVEIALEVTGDGRRIGRIGIHFQGQSRTLARETKL